jgi:RNA-directed DNA polymerase
LSLARIRIENWLKLRGLTLNAEKSSLKKWRHNTKIDFLGFTFHNILNPTQSKVTEQRTPSGELKMRGGLYVYPSALSVSTFKQKIKSVMTKNLNASPYHIVTLLNPIIRGWGNYFGIGTLRVFSRLDHFLYYRLWRYLRRKYKKVSTGRLIERYFQGVSTPTGRTWQFHGTKSKSKSNQLLSLLKDRRGDIKWLILLCKLNTPVPAHMFKTSPKLRSTSKYVCGQEHTGWHERIVSLRSQSWSNNWTELYKRQKGLCPLCKGSLGYLLEENLEIHHKETVAKAARTGVRGITSQEINGLENLLLLHKTCHKGTKGTLSEK